MKNVTSIVLSAAIASGMTIATYKWMDESQKGIPVQETNQTDLPVHPASYYAKTASLDFTKASEKVMPAVVHIKSVQRADRNSYNNRRIDPFREFFGYPQQPRQENRRQESSGSGVVINKDGYIVTNNHVIDGAEEIEVSLHDNRTYQATLVGRDPSTDLALLKIDEKELAHISLVDSDEVQVGEWVLAVGNPFKLNSTVTSGIVSAKARNINISGGKMVESFIQTDAAVNPGNSGGALVNVRGELVGINTAISSQTGSYVGYSFAVPSNIAKKIVDDLLEFGAVQEAILGINIDNSNTDIEGVKISSLSEGSGAEASGLKTGDIIMKVNSVKISKFSELRGQLTAKRPGELVDITVNRDGKFITKKVKLSKKDVFASRTFNILLKNLTKKEQKEAGISGGAKIIQNRNKNLEYYGVKQGYIISKINKKEVKDASETAKILDAVYGKGSPVYI